MKTLEERRHALAALHAPTAQEKIEQILDYGRDELGADFAILSEIERGTDCYTVQAVAPREGAIEVGQQFTFSKTYCDITIRLGQTIAISYMHDSEHHLHPCYEAFKLESYIGAPIYIGGNLYGTLNFSSASPQEPAFTSDDRQFVTMLSYEISQLIENNT